MSLTYQSYENMEEMLGTRSSDSALQVHIDRTAALATKHGETTAAARKLKHRFTEQVRKRATVFDFDIKRLQELEKAMDEVERS